MGNAFSLPYLSQYTLKSGNIQEAIKSSFESDVGVPFWEGSLVSESVWIVGIWAKGI